ncbi:MAG: acetoacetate--CoA ligase, partial [Chloroflexota bacterium]
MNEEQVREGTVLWEPSEAFKANTMLTRYMRYLGTRAGRAFENYEALRQWSISDLEGFWESLWEFFGIHASTPYTQVLEGRAMPGAQWFIGARLNYAEHIFRRGDRQGTALLAKSEGEPVRAVSWEELSGQVAALATTLRELGVRQGDRVVAYMPNIPQTVVALLACAVLGAIWSCCPPEFGAPSVRDRFAQLDPKVLIAVDGYRYNGTSYSRLDTITRLRQLLPTVEATIVVPHLSDASSLQGLDGALLWSDALGRGLGAALSFTQVPFDHPLWVLYSSGTTGIPKAIVHGHGGILLEHLKSLILQTDLRPGERYLSFTTTGWMMWNLSVSTLLVGAVPILYDGNPAYPSQDTLWQLAEETEANYLGISPAFITACARAGLHPGREHKLDALKSVRATGSPLTPEGTAWVYRHVKRDLWFVVSAGGTEICSAFVGGSPLLPVRAGEMQCRYLGVDVRAYDEHGHSVIDQIGELVIAAPMPSMPLFFWGDHDNRLYRESYFSAYPGAWRHGDRFRITANGGCVIYGRSDATINRHGVRMGAGDIYRVMESMPRVVDSLVVDLEVLGRDSFMPLFVVLRDGAKLDEALEREIKARIRADLSPRHVPDAILAVPAVPYTLNGKKLEVPVRKILLGTPVEQAVSADALS